MNENETSKKEESNEASSPVLKLTGMSSLDKLVRGVKEFYRSIFEHESLEPLLARPSYMQRREDDHVNTEGLVNTEIKNKPDSLLSASKPKAEVRRLVPKLVIDNKVRSIDTFENSIEMSLENAGYRIMHKMQNAQSVEDLIDCVRKDFVYEIRKIEGKISIDERSQITLIGAGGIKVTVNMREDMLPEYKYTESALEEYCTFIRSSGGRLKKSLVNNIGYRLPFHNSIQIIFDLDVTPPTNIYDSIASDEVRYYDILGKSLIPMTEAFVQRLEEINKVTRGMYIDYETGLLNRTSYMETREFLKSAGIPFTEYFIETIKDNFPTIILGYRGNKAILETVADKVKNIDSDMAFLFEDDSEKFIVFIDTTNSIEIEKKLLDIKTKLSAPIPGISIPIEIIFFTRRTPDGKVQLY